MKNRLQKSMFITSKLIVPMLIASFAISVFILTSTNIT